MKTKDILFIVLIISNIILSISIRHIKKSLVSYQEQERNLIQVIDDFGNYIDTYYEHLNLLNFKLEDKINFEICESNENQVFILAPNDVCNACLNNLLTEIKQYHIQSKNIYIITDKSNTLRKREWISFGYRPENFKISSADKFQKFDLNEQIYVMKYNLCDNNKAYFLYKTGYDNGLELFLNSKI